MENKTTAKSGRKVLPQRIFLPHDVPSWVEDEAVFFITVCCEQRGRNQLCNVFFFEEAVRTSGIYVQKTLWYPHLLLFMPDHFHGLVSFGLESPMKKCVSNFKRYLARKCGIVWQRDFFDHRLRGDESYEEKAAYIMNNPVRKGLCMNSKDWPWVIRNG